MKFVAIILGLMSSGSAYAQVGASISINPMAILAEDVWESTKNNTQLVEGELIGASLVYSNHLSLDLIEVGEDDVFVSAYTRMSHADITISINDVPMVNNDSSIQGYYLGKKHELSGKTIKIYSRNSKVYSMAGDVSDLNIEFGPSRKSVSQKIGFRMKNENLINKYSIKIDLK